MVRHKRCCYMFCKNDTRYPDRASLRGAYFIPFPKPITQLAKCKTWLKACKLNIRLDKIGNHTYICSKHFVGFNGPTANHPNPIPPDFELYNFKVPVKKADRYKGSSRAPCPRKQASAPCPIKQEEETAKPCSSAEQQNLIAPAYVICYYNKEVKEHSAVKEESTPGNYSLSAGESIEPNSTKTMDFSESIIEKQTDLESTDFEAIVPTNAEVTDIDTVEQTEDQVVKEFSIADLMEESSSLKPTVKCESVDENVVDELLSDIDQSKATPSIDSLDYICLSSYPKGWTCCVFEETNEICLNKQFKAQEDPLISVVINSNGTLMLSVIGTKVMHENPIFSQIPKWIGHKNDVQDFLAFLDSQTICRGNSEEKFTVFATTPQPCGYFNSKTGAMHSMNCHLFVDQMSSKRCKQCANFRKTLNVRDLRAKNRAKNHSDETCNSPHRNLNNEEMREQIKMMQRKLENIKSCNTYLRKKIEICPKTFSTSEEDSVEEITDLLTDNMEKLEPESFHDFF